MRTNLTWLLNACGFHLIKNSFIDTCADLGIDIDCFFCCSNSFKPLSVPISPAPGSEEARGPLRALRMMPIRWTSRWSLSHALRVGTCRRLCKCESHLPIRRLSLNHCIFIPARFLLWLTTRISSLFSGVYDYELTLRTDMYTKKHTQWFYFRVGNMKAGVTYRFTIINLMKSSSLYSQGMKPLLYSEREAMEKGVGWQRTGSNIKYFRNYNQVGELKMSVYWILLSHFLLFQQLSWTL